MLKVEYLKEISSKAENSAVNSLKDRRLMLALYHDNIEQQLKNIPAAPQTGVDLNLAKRTELTEKVNLCKSQLQEVEKELTELDSFASNLKEKLEFPTLGFTDELDIEQLRLHCPIFSPTNDSTSFEEFWQKLVSYAESYGLSEKAFKNALSNLLQKEAFRLFYRLRNKPLKEIIKALDGSFNDYKTVIDFKHQFDSFKRDSGQSLGNFMNEAHTMLMQTDPLLSKDPEINKGQKDILLEQKLLQNVSKKALKAIRKAGDASMELGLRLSFEQLLEIAKRAEHEELHPYTRA